MSKENIEKTEGGELILRFNEEYIAPATIDKKIIDWELLEQRTIEIEKNLDTVFSFDEGINHISDLRKEIASSKSQLDDFRKKVKKHLEADSNKLNKKFVEYVDRYEKVRIHLYAIEQDFEKKELEEKKKKIQEFKTKLSEKLELKSLDKYILDNPRWENKTFKFIEIEKEIETQIDSINKKYKLIVEQLKALNEEIENKIDFESVERIFNKDYDEIFKYIIDKKNQIKTTEDNMRRKAEEDKQKAIEQANAKAEKEKQEAIEKAKEDERKRIELEQKNNSTASIQPQNASVQSKNDPVITETQEKNTEFKENVQKNEKITQNEESKKVTYIVINVTGLTEKATEELLEAIKENEIEYTVEER